MARYQVAGDKRADRADHVWQLQTVLVRDGKVTRFQCVTCGAVCVSPPNYPTPKTWMPDVYEKLNRETRDAL